MSRLLIVLLLMFSLSTAFAYQKEKASKSDKQVPEGQPSEQVEKFEGTVTRVKSAGEVIIDGKEFRLLGLIAPQPFWGDCYSTESVKFLENRVLDKNVQYAFDTTQRPANTKGVRRIYLYKDERLLNADLVAAGQVLVDKSKEYTEKKRFVELEKNAKLHGLGLWRSCVVECVRRNNICRIETW